MRAWQQGVVPCPRCYRLADSRLSRSNCFGHHGANRRGGGGQGWRTDRVVHAKRTLRRRQRIGREGMGARGAKPRHIVLEILRIGVRSNPPGRARGKRAAHIAFAGITGMRRHLATLVRSHMHRLWHDPKPRSFGLRLHAGSILRRNRIVGAKALGRALPLRSRSPLPIRLGHRTARYQVGRCRTRPIPWPAVSTRQKGGQQEGLLRQGRRRPGTTLIGRLHDRRQNGSSQARHSVSLGKR